MALADGSDSSTGGRFDGVLPDPAELYPDARGTCGTGGMTLIAPKYLLEILLMEVQSILQPGPEEQQSDHV